MTSIAALSKDLKSYLEPHQVNQVVKAYHFASEAHEGQKRKSGEPYITHPLAVAKILAEMHMDHQCLMAALLHDVIEDTSIPKHTLGQEFDDEVAELVDGVSKLKIVFQSRAEAEAENFQKMTLAMAKDIRVILVKLADRLHNMRTLGYLNPEKRRRIAKETLEIYAPIALRLGMNNLRVEFEELGFKAMYPLRSSMIEKAVKKARGNRTEIVDQIKESIENCLSRLNISGEVFGRQKHLFSIYEKMRNKRKSFSEIMDVYAFRIVVTEVDDCYRSLGAVHNLYKPVSARLIAAERPANPEPITSTFLFSTKVKLVLASVCSKFFFQLFSGNVNSIFHSTNRNLQSISNFMVFKSSEIHHKWCLIYIV